MNSSKFRMESGIQLLARLNKKPEIGNFYPVLFNTGPRNGDIIEVFSDTCTTTLVTDLICEALISSNIGGGKAAGALLFNVDGNFNFDNFVNILRKKICNHLNSCELKIEPDSLLRETLKNFHIVNIYNATHLYTTIYNLENILIDHPNISLLIFDTITAFYWSEQSFKKTKMDFYIKNLLRMIDKVTKEHKNVVLYTRPEYFSSSSDAICSLEPCCEHSMPDRLNYQIQQTNLGDDEGTHIIHVVTFNTDFKRYFKIIDGHVQWLKD